MTLMTRYLSVSRVEREANNDLKSSLLGSDRPSGLYKLLWEWSVGDIWGYPEINVGKSVRTYARCSLHSVI